MRRDTDERIRESEGRGETLDEKMARLTGRTSTSSVPIPEATLHTDTQLVTMTMDELHDVLFAAASTYLQTLSNMTKHRAHDHAGRIAETGRQIVLGTDYTHRGPDPRG